MGSILNFVYGNTEINGNNFFHQSGLYNYVNNNPNFSKTTNYHLSNSTKNIFLLECKESLHDFYKKDENGKTILELLPIDFINSIKNGDTKILVASIAYRRSWPGRSCTNVISSL